MYQEQCQRIQELAAIPESFDVCAGSETNLLSGSDTGGERE